ncbi:hypothetical protein L228DRAFT_170648 [Xylona heveae TC161]|uniref:FAD-binding FR-type domain-containing protein n=1 Tax=Xylona heveae (strain CBS 132557 / TC161) TaxID=1328760 RepID=A0A165FSR5_XYLHT|nr:hypothetical protein L228DRAFT_170648 [Xylona heveae TC161]KZF21331.1 hypothetical protein L228DRAFT_170648 [Xylona heveae TC161]
MQRSFLFAAVALLLSPWAGMEVAAAGKATSDCGNACSLALIYTNFEGGSTKQNRYVQQCTNNLAITSVYACMESFCSPAEIDVGMNALNEQCDEIAGKSLPSYDSIIKGINLNELQHLSYANHTRPVKGPVVPTLDLYQAAFNTMHASTDQQNHDGIYSYAMSGFWAVVILFGMCYRLVAFFTHPKPKTTQGTGDVESHDEKRKIRWHQKITKLVNKHVVLPAAFGNHHQEPLGWFMVPTRIQGLFIVAFVAVNIALVACNYEIFAQNLYWPKKSLQIWRYLADRTGYLCFGNLPLVWLFASRNNVLLWLTGWSFPTYNMFHRWVARVATAEAVIHGVCYTAYALDVGGSQALKKDYHKLYWQMGVVAVVCFGLLMGFSLLPLRQKCYEFFLVSHIVLALISLVALFYHVAIFDGEYDPYLWSCVAVWCLDRFLRLARVVIINFKALVLQDSPARCYYSEEADMIYLELEPSFHLKPSAGAFYYIYFPTWWGRWESHPFTLSSWSYGNQQSFLDRLPRENSFSKDDKKGALVSESPASPPDSVKLTPVSSPNDRLKLTFLIRPCDGVTKHLRKTISKTPNKLKNFRVLVEGPYGQAEHLNGYERVLYVAGGSGITAITSSMLSLANRAETKGIKCPVPKYLHIVWAARQSGLLREVFETQLYPLMCRLAAADAGVTITVELFHTQGNAETPVPVANVNEHPAMTVRQVVGEQPNIPEIVREDATDARDNMAIFICGPGRIADVTRSAACEAQMLTAARVDFFEEAFAW